MKYFIYNLYISKYFKSFPSVDHNDVISHYMSICFINFMNFILKFLLSSEKSIYFFQPFNKNYVIRCFLTVCCMAHIWTHVLALLAIYKVQCPWIPVFPAFLERMDNTWVCYVLASRVLLLSMKFMKRGQHAKMEDCGLETRF